MSGLKLEGELTLDGSGFERTMDKASEKVHEFGTEQLGSIKGMFAEAFAVGAIIEGTRRAIEFGEQIKNTATRLGVSTTAAQEFDFAAKQTGIDLDHVATGLDKLAKALTAIDEGSEGAAKMENAFKRLGISVEEIKGKTPEEVFKIIGEKMEGMTITAGVTTSMMELFGKSGAKLIPMLKDMNENISKVRENGMILGPEDIAALDDASKSMKEFGLLTEVLSSKAFIGIRALTTGWYDYAKAILTAKEATDTVVGEARIKAMEKTLAIQRAMNDETKAFSVRTEVDETDRTPEEKKENKRQKDELDKDTERRAEKRRENKENEGLTVDQKVSKTIDHVKELQDALKKLDANGGSGTGAESDIKNQIEKAKDLLDSLYKERKNENKPKHGAHFHSDSAVNSGNFLGSNFREIPGIHDATLRASRDNTNSIVNLTKAIADFAAQMGAGGGASDGIP